MEEFKSCTVFGQEFFLQEDFVTLRSYPTNYPNGQKPLQERAALTDSYGVQT
jgi:hypothetical protein